MNYRLPQAKTPPARLLSILAVFSIALSGCAATQQAEPEVRLLRRPQTPVEIAIDRNRDWIRATRALPAFYRAREWQTAWVSETEVFATADEMVRALERAERDGLEPRDYHLERIRELIEEARSYPPPPVPNGEPAPTGNGAKSAQQPGAGTGPPVGSYPRPDADDMLELDLRLSDAFLLLATHLTAGRTDPTLVHGEEWIPNRRDPAAEHRLEDAVRSGEIERTLDRLLPPHPEYRRLREARARYLREAAEGGWPTVPEGDDLWTGGETGPRVVALRRRLIATGELDAALADSPVFDAELAAAVKRFQSRHGTGVDGIVGPGTLAALNVPVERRIDQIEVNMERWRWVPSDFGALYLRVNIPDYRLDLVERGRVSMSMRVVVGKPERRTPVFSGEMAYLVLNPRWHVPPSLAVEDILPKVRADRSYLAVRNFKVYEGRHGDGREVPASAIDWQRVSAESFNYQFRQEPGPTNSLGRVKFMFPNRFNVYLHDTPVRELFEKPERPYSAGCVRLERAMDLATYVLTVDRGWTREKLDQVLAGGAEQSITLHDTVPVHLLYWTAWVDGDGRVQFRKDVYERDAQVRAALREEPRRVG